MKKRELVFTTKNISRKSLVTFANDPVLLEDMANCLKSFKFKKAYENGLICLHQLPEDHFICSCRDYIVVDKWNDSNYGEVYLVYCDDFDCGEYGIAYVTTRASLITVKYSSVKDPENKVILGKDRKDRDVLVLMSRDGKKAKVTRDTKDEFDSEKAVLYGMAKMYGIPREEILNFINLVNKAINYNKVMKEENNNMKVFDKISITEMKEINKIDKK